ncbi:MAG: hypothetical protein KKE02_15080 [Alphaproteobacteria bacterium]|nr:hypothetical protein [Alphaproteobacteria bacterium]MBU1516184.1 hypothetical protein [Alphaproteobacteria bacterium]MBU2093494.1 hypothetical protein [Alphaproteobacteria bacterium]MBU2152342.1 hypothetical protein [Alphaproteobacteria bacterium]MBU2308156.1 hypothetical protein [Alphaproteobacteria bacterium]
MRALLSALVLIATPALAQPAITDAQVRAFVARQEQAWNAGRIDAYFAAFTLDARFTDQAYVGDKPPVPYGTSTLVQARAQTRKAFARAKMREVGQVTRIERAADGRSVRVVSNVSSTIESSGKVRRICASRGQALVLRGGRLLSNGHTDTIFKCANR